MPKSITRGPSAASSTFDGFRSRCTTPASWMACNASATPAISHSTADRQRPAAGDRFGQGRPGHVQRGQPAGSPSASPSINSAVYAPRTRRAASISRPNRRLKSGSSASSGRTTLIAAGGPPCVCDR
ncbi:hypothetical protein SGLAM104S_05633 [Streptomyces glaucescens]